LNQDSRKRKLNKNQPSRTKKPKVNTGANGKRKSVLSSTSIENEDSKSDGFLSEISESLFCNDSLF
jgi:hypothetical protein